jgi:hypothetical protein
MKHMKTSSRVSRKGDISMETIVMIVIALAVLLVVIGIFTFQSRKGSGKINDMGDSASNSATEGMCLGSITSSGETIELKCMSACDADLIQTEKKLDGSKKYSEMVLYEKRKCVMPEQQCCGYKLAK